MYLNQFEIFLFYNTREVTVDLHKTAAWIAHEYTISDVND